MKSSLQYLVQSATIMSWAAYLSQALGLLVLAPLLLTRLDTNQIVLWYMLFTLMRFQVLIDMGFSTTFTRIIAYAMGGADFHRDYRDRSVPSGEGSPNWKHVAEIYGTVRAVYARLTPVLIVFLGAVGTLSLWKPVSAGSDPSKAWLSWGIILASSPAELRDKVRRLASEPPPAANHFSHYLALNCNLAGAPPSEIISRLLLSLPRYPGDGRRMGLLQGWFYKTRQALHLKKVALLAGLGRRS